MAAIYQQQKDVAKYLIENGTNLKKETRPSFLSFNKRRYDLLEIARKAKANKAFYEYLKEKNKN